MAEKSKPGQRKAGVRVADDHADEDVESAEQTLEQHCDEQHRDEGDDGGVGSDFEVVPHARSQVEADDGHDGAVDDRRHDDVDPLGARVMDEHTDQASRMPVTMMPKLATAMPLLAVVTAVIGAMKPKDEPK